MIFRYIIFLIVISVFTGCGQNSCHNFNHEKYPSGIFNLADSTKTQFEEAIVKFGEPKELETELESYRMFYAHSLSRLYNLWIFEKTEDGGLLRFKEFDHYSDFEFPKLRDSSEVKLSIEDWRHLEYLIKKNNFWIAIEFKEELVADGGAYILEGYRPDAKLCDKLERKTVFRVGSSNIDEINWLCSDLISMYIHKDSK